MTTETFISIQWVKPLWKKLESIWDTRNGQIQEIASVFGDPRELTHYYVEPSCQQHNPVDHDEDVRAPIFTTINDFLGKPTPVRDGRNQLFILADAGMGNTSLFLMLKLSQLLEFWPKGYDCLLLKLGQDTLSRIDAHENQADTVLLLDALEEDPSAYGRIGERIEELLVHSRHFRHVIISCRTQFFPETDLELFHRHGRVSVGPYTCPILFLSLFTNSRVRDYLLKRFPHPWHHWFTGRNDRRFDQAERLLNTMRSLRFRPLLLAHIEDLLEAEQPARDAYHVYEALIKTWLNREIRKMKAQRLGSIPTQEELWVACRVLAVCLQAQARSSLPESELLELIRHLPEVRQLEHLGFDGCSLLNRNSERDYHFAHYSIQEFFLVSAVVDKTLQADLQRCPEWARGQRPRATVQMFEFLKKSGAAKQALGEFISALDTRGIGPVVFKDPMAKDRKGPEMLIIPPGEFKMGFDTGNSAHLVRITKPFAIGRYPVTFEEFGRFCKAVGKCLPKNEGWGTLRRPVINVSWTETQAYCDWLSQQTGKSYRLPTEAEWEYACRAGTDTAFFWGDDPAKANGYAWYDNNSGGKTQPVGKKRPNPWGLYDMAGNVWEWVQDGWHDELQDGPVDGSAWIGPEHGLRVVRGGSWDYGPVNLRSATRDRDTPDFRSLILGFRLAQDL